MKFSIEEVLYSPSDAEEDLVKTEAVHATTIDSDHVEMIDDGRGWDSDCWIG
jgi:hypothetical protein